MCVDGVVESQCDSVIGSQQSLDRANELLSTSIQRDQQATLVTSGMPILVRAQTANRPLTSTDIDDLQVLATAALDECKTNGVDTRIQAIFTLIIQFIHTAYRK
jgi:hypothetical protein